MPITSIGTPTGNTELFFTPPSGFAPLAVNFYHVGPTAFGDIVSGKIFFGDGASFTVGATSPGNFLTQHIYLNPGTYDITTDEWIYQLGIGQTGFLGNLVVKSLTFPIGGTTVPETFFVPGMAKASNVNPYPGVAKTYGFINFGGNVGDNGPTGRRYRGFPDELLGTKIPNEFWPGGTGIYNYVMNYVKPQYYRRQPDELICWCPFGAATGPRDLEFDQRSACLASGTGPNGQFLYQICGATGSTYGSSEFIRAWTDFYNDTGVIPTFYLGTVDGDQEAKYSAIVNSSGIDGLSAYVGTQIDLIRKLPYSKVILDASGVEPGTIPPAGFTADGAERRYTWAFLIRRMMLEQGIQQVGTEPRPKARVAEYWSDDPTCLAYTVDELWYRTIETAYDTPPTGDPRQRWPVPVRFANCKFAVQFSGVGSNEFAFEAFDGATGTRNAISLLDGSAKGTPISIVSGFADGFTNIYRDLKIKAYQNVFSSISRPRNQQGSLIFSNGRLYRPEDLEALRRVYNF